MGRIAYLNGQYAPIEDALVHVEDRGFQFSDGVYEAWAVRARTFLDMDWHLDRLERSLRELNITPPVSRASLVLILNEVVRRNRLKDAFVYLQITRGSAPRDHKFPIPEVPPTLVITVKPMPKAGSDQRAKIGVSVITTPDERWKRRDIKTVSLLANILAKQKAHEAGAFEAWMVDEAGFVTEGTSTSAWILSKDGVLITRQKDTSILWGVTRLAVTKIAEKAGLKLEERAFTVKEAQQAREAFLTSATSQIMPVVEIDGQPIGNGVPGSVVEDLRALYFSLQNENLSS